MLAVFDMIKRVAGSDINVLITGESGTGKELAARAIHYNSPRRRSRFVPINCAGIPETLLESELFGYVRGAFREDLFFRLNVTSIHLPPVRERGEDLRLLTQHFIGKHATAQSRAVTGISREALRLLEAYPWPGNVRELENAVEHAVAFAQGGTIRPEHLPSFLHEGRGNLVEVGASRAMTLRELQERYITRILEETGGDPEKAARILGVHPRTLRRRAQRAGNEEEMR